jgi:hypothetical protein
MNLRRAISALVVLFALPRATQAQLTDIRGTVQDSASLTPVPAAVVMLLDANGVTLLRTLTSDKGQYRLLRTADATTLRVVRLGFTPVTVPLSNATSRAEGGYTLDVRLPPFARALQQVEVAAARGCETRADRGGAFGLLDGARAGLLASVVANEKDPPQLHVLRFERILDGDGVETVSQTVRVDSSAGATTSFNATQSAENFLANGFRSGTSGDFTFYSPDANVLLDARFQNGYCFTTVAGSTARPTKVGLRFTPATRRSGRVDIDGTMWLDTAAKTLNEIEFKYVGIEALAEGLNAGGRITFRTLPNGVPFIERWMLRLVGANAPDAGGAAFLVREIGGELAQARWSDGRVWSAPLGTVHITAVGSSNQPAPNTMLRLAGTEYRATTDAMGRASIPNVLPGPYSVLVDDPVLRPLHLDLETGRSFTASRASAMVVRTEVGGPITIARRLCQRSDAPKNDESWVLARTIDDAGQPIAGVRWQLLEADEGKWKQRTDVGTTGGTGVFAICKGLDRGVTVELVAWRDTDTVRVRRVLEQPLVAVPLAFAPRRAAALTPLLRRGEPALTLSGAVVDSITGLPVADARVTLLDSPFEGATDGSGQFVVGGVPRGRYTVEVGTPALDSVGIVARRVIDLRDNDPPLRLFAPETRGAIRNACGVTTDGTAGSLLVGQLSSVTKNSAAIAGYRLVAEWEADTSTLAVTDSLGQSRLSGWMRTTPDPTSGAYRLCGLPVGRLVALRAEAENMAAGAAPPSAVVIDPVRRVVRADLRIDPALIAAPTFSGTVSEEDTGTPIERAEVLIKDTGRSALTDRRGQFRLSDLTEGPHLVSIRARGHAPYLGTVQFAAGRAVEQNIVMPRAAQALGPVEITGSGTPVEFEERRSLGLGAYLTAAEIDAASGLRLGTLMAQAKGFGAAVNGVSGGAHAFVLGKRAPSHVLPRSDDLARQGYYCPSATDRAQGLTQCACFSQVYIDDRLTNGGRPTEPFDVNTVPTQQIAGVEFYASPASTPARYSQLDAVCGVMLIWTRRR